MARKRLPRVTCEYCLREFTVQMHGRFHGDKCPEHPANKKSKAPRSSFGERMRAAANARRIAAGKPSIEEQERINAEKSRKRKQRIEQNAKLAAEVEAKKAEQSEALDKKIIAKELVAYENGLIKYTDNPEPITETEYARFKACLEFLGHDVIYKNPTKSLLFLFAITYTDLSSSFISGLRYSRICPVTGAMKGKDHALPELFLELLELSQEERGAVISQKIFESEEYEDQSVASVVTGIRESFETYSAIKAAKLQHNPVASLARERRRETIRYNQPEPEKTVIARKRKTSDKTRDEIIAKRNASLASGAYYIPGINRRQNG